MVDQPRQAGAIEVTPAMIEAGVKAYDSYQGWSKNGHVEAIFRAMLCAAKGQEEMNVYQVNARTLAGNCAC